MKSEDDNNKKILRNNIIKLKNLILGAVYLPPFNQSNVYETHANSIDIIIHNFPQHSLISCGDFNLPESWSKCTRFFILLNFKFKKGF